MSTTIDNKVVEMRFDNAQFESGVKSTLSILEKLKQGLNLSGASKGLETASASFSEFETLACRAGFHIEDVWLKMSNVFEYQIARRVINAATNMAKALTIDPIKTGFSEYETQINAVQTILANTSSKGTTLEDVNSALDELNTYADKTIYNFTEMTRNIGTFTAAGIDLDTSVSAIQGIANLAAVSGSTSQQASTAMYQLSQALSSGTVKLQDWNSVVNAGMGGQVFQDALKETAKVHGVAIDDIIAKHGSFRESLSEGWITAEILTETLKKFTLYAEEGTAEWEEYKKSLMSQGYTAEQAEEILKMGKTATEAATKVKTFTQLWDTLKEAAQSGWTQSWEIIVGDFEEAKTLLTEISNVLNELIGNSAEARNEVLENWKALGGRTAIIEALRNAFEGVMSIVTPIAEAFKDIFPPITAEQLVAFSKGLRDLTAKLKLSDNASENLKATFRGLFAIFGIIKQAIVAVFKVIKPLFGYVDDAGGGILRLTAAIGDWLTALNASIEHGDLFYRAFSKVVDVVKKIGSYLKKTFVVPGMEVFSAFLTKIQNGFSAVEVVADGAKTGITSVFDAISDSIRKSDFFGLFEAMWKGIQIVGSAITKIFQGIGSGLGDLIGNFNYDALLQVIKTLVIGGVGFKLVDFIDTIKGAVDGLPELLGNISGCFEEFQNSLKAGTLLKISVAIAILAAALFVLATIDSDKLMSAVGVISVLFVELTMAVKAMNGLEQKKGMFKTAKTLALMIGVSTAILILASALKTIAGLDIQEMTVAVAGIAGLMAIMVVAMKVLSGSDSDKSLVKGAYQMILVSAAVLVLALALRTLSDLSWEEIAKGLTGVVVMMAAMTVAIKAMTSDGLKGITTMVKGAGSMVLMAAAIVIMSKALKSLSGLSWNELAVGLAGIAGALAAMVIAMNLMPKASSLTSAAAIVLVSGAMVILTVAMKEVAKLSWTDIGKSLVVFGGALAILAVGLNFMLAALPGAYALAVAAAALVLIAIPMKELSKLSWDGVAKGLVAIGGAIAILAAGLNLMIAALPGAGALLVAAVALAILTPILFTLGNMEWSTIAKGLAAIAAAFIVIGAAGLVLTPVIPSILALSAALLLIGTSIIVAAVGLAIGGAALTAVAAGITALSVALSAGATAIVSGLTVIIVGLIDLIPTILEKIGEGIVAICVVIADSASAIAEAFITIVLAIIDILGQCVPPLVDVLILLIDKVLTALVDYTPKFVAQLYTVIIGIIDGLSEYVPDLIASAIQLLFKLIVGIIRGIADGVVTLIESAVDIIAALFQGIADAMNNVDTKALTDGIEAIQLLTKLVGSLAGVAVLTPLAMVGVVGMGVTLLELAGVLATIGLISHLPGLKWLVGEGGDFLQLVGTALGQFVGGLVGGMALGVTSSLPQIGTDLANFMTNLMPFITGAALIDDSLVNSIHSLIDVILAITGASIVQQISAFLMGESSISKFSEELVQLGKGLKGFSDEVAGIVPENITAAVEAGKALTELADTIPNEGGIISWFAGDNSVSKFGADIIELGKGLKGFSDEITGIVPENLTAAADAAKALADMTNYIPNEGGIISWISGENSVTRFADTLPKLGKGLKGFSDEIAGVVPENIMAAAEAAKALADMTSALPNEGGVISWFAGDSSVSKFADDIVELGGGLKGFSDAVAGVLPENITAAANAAKSLADMTAAIPNEGGMISWFTGESSVSKFADQLPLLGDGLKGFSDAISGIVPENITAAADAAKSLAQMADTIPNEGGMVAWFAGENSVSKFSAELPLLGAALKGFSDAVTGVVPDNLTAAANAAKSLADMTATLPNEGGIKAWFSGESGVAKFSSELPLVGEALKSFSDSVEGVNADNLTAAANAAKALADMASVIPSEGGIKAWFSGESSITKFADKLPTLGEGLKGFSDAVAGIVPENVTAAANAAKALAQMADTIPNKLDNITKFGNKLGDFGDKLKTYFSKMSGVSSSSIDSAKKALEAVKEATNLQSGNIESTANAIEDIADALKELANVPKNCASEFTKALKELGDKSADALLKPFTDAKSDFKEAGKKVIAAFIDGVEANEKKAKAACEDLIDACVDKIGDSESDFKSAGKNLVIGFANGIDANSYKAEAKARAMAKAAAEAAEEALDINSPSKVGYGIGDFFGIGFVNALSDNVNTSYNAGAGIADAARKGLSAAASKIQSLINGDMDMQPTISPVLDLDGVKTGVNAISSMFSSDTSLGVSANVGAISTMMSRRNQNGESEVVSALNELRKDIGNMQTSSYTINGITYDDGSNIASAVSDLVRAAKVERRI